MQMNEELRNRIENEAVAFASNNDNGEFVTTDGFVVIIETETVFLGGDGWNEPREYGTVGTVGILTPDEEDEIGWGQIVPEDGLLGIDWI